MKSYQEILANADAYKATDNTYHSLSHGYLQFGDDFDKFPWEYVTKIVNDGTWRWNMPISYSFLAEIDGLTFAWSIDVEGKHNGTGDIQFDFDLIRKVSDHLPREIRIDFADKLAKNMTKFDATVENARQYYTKVLKHRNDLETVIVGIQYDMVPPTPESLEEVRRRNDR